MRLTIGQLITQYINLSEGQVELCKSVKNNVQCKICAYTLETAYFKFSIRFRIHTTTHTKHFSVLFRARGSHCYMKSSFFPATNKQNYTFQVFKEHKTIKLSANEFFRVSPWSAISDEIQKRRIFYQVIKTYLLGKQKFCVILSPCWR